MNWFRLKLNNFYFYIFYLYISRFFRILLSITYSHVLCWNHKLWKNISSNVYAFWFYIVLLFNYCLFVDLIFLHYMANNYEWLQKRNDLKVRQKNIKWYRKRQFLVQIVVLHTNGATQIRMTRIRSQTAILDVYIL